MEPWPSAYPDLWDEQTQELERIGFRLDTDEFEHGRVVFHGETDTDDGPITLTLVFPASFPFLRPEIYAPDRRLGRHQNPFHRNLCVLDRSTRAWDVDDSVAELITDQVPHLIRLVKAGGEELREGEVPQGEPFSRYFASLRGTAIFIPQAMLELPTTIRAGLMRLAIGEGEEAGPALRACLAKITKTGRGKGHSSGDGEEVATLDEQLAIRFSRTVLAGSWVRLDNFELDGDQPDDLLAAAGEADGYVEPDWQKVKGGRIKVVGLVAREEVRQGEFEDAWLFVCRWKTGGGEKACITRGERLGITDLQARIPSLAGLQEKTVALAGLGALGGPLAFELARALVGRLRVLDHDEVEAGTTVRWPAGLGAVGHPKTAVIAQTILSHWPFTQVERIDHRIGNAFHPDELRGADKTGGSIEPEVEGMNRFFGGAHLLVDATAELGIQHFLSRQADQLGLPQIYVWMTEGGWGGVVARVMPGQTGCWFCLQHHLDDGTIPLPPLEETGTVQPRGCTALTFTGAGFDSLALVAQATRVAARTLLHGRHDSEGGHDVFVCSQPVEEDGFVSAPEWRAFKLERHPECSYCRVS